MFYLIINILSSFFLLFLVIAARTSIFKANEGKRNKFDFYGNTPLDINWGSLAFIVLLWIFFCIGLFWWVYF